MRRIQGDRGACHKLFDHLQDVCNLTVFANESNESDVVTKSNLSCDDLKPLLSSKELQLYDSSVPLSLPKSLQEEFHNHDESTRNLLRFLFEQQKGTLYETTKLSTWQDIAKLSATNSAAAKEILRLCTGLNVTTSMPDIFQTMITLLKQGDTDDQIKFCILGTILNCLQQQKKTEFLCSHALHRLTILINSAALSIATNYGGWP